MDVIQGILYGFQLALTPELLLAALIGAVLGTLVGVLPGIGPVAGAAIILPLTFSYSPAVGLIMIAGIYLGAQYGGSTTSVLLNIPGEGSAIVATFDGYKMTQKGRGGAALTIMAVGSFIAGTIALVLLMSFSKVLADVTLSFGSPEFLALTAGGLIALARISGGSLSDGLVPMVVGVAVSTIGLEGATGFSRFTFGNLDLTLGIALASVAVGLFGISELMLMLEDKTGVKMPSRIRLKELLPTRTEWKRAVAPWIRGSFIGFIFGLLPGPSASLSTFTSYKVEKSVSKYRKEIGTGAVEGIAGPEAANNSAALASLAPVLVLGLPFSATLALMLSAMVVQGVQPGPLLITQHPEIFWSIIAAMYIANVMLLILNLPMVGIWVQFLKTPRNILIPIIVVVAAVGSFSIHNNMIDIYMIMVFGALGYVFRKLKFNLAALLVGLVLGPLIEKYFREGMFISGGNPMYFLSTPIAVGIWIIVILAVIGSSLWAVIVKMRKARGKETPVMSDIDE
ncbi:MAG: tripartite tricarboxylate transporter TctA [Rhodoglobus sp.]|jgi:putative tricarboxylic transport membrane protein|nr:tripartite tricarboxylate transporter TctA [Rhodoglobus sp.]